MPLRRIPEFAAPSRRLVLRLATGSILLMAGIARAQDRAGAVEDVKGEAYVEKDAQRRALGRAAPLFVKDQVATGEASRVAMKLGRDTTIKLGERARLVIDRYLVDAGGEINLESGPMLFDRAPGTRPEPMRIRSPFGLIAVRGTRFFAGPSNDAFGVFVQQGRVTVRAAGRQVTVRAGYGTDIRRPGAAPSAPARWREARVRAALASVG